MFLSETDINEISDDQAENFVFVDEYETPHKSDFAVVLGCDTESAKKRADIAAEFYKNGYAQKMVVSGGVEHDGVKECDVMRDRLIEKGVPERDIIVESRATDTIENMVCSLDMICKSCSVMRECNSVTVITEPYHIVRSVVLAKLFMPEFVKVYGYTKGVDEQKRVWKSELRKAVNSEITMLGEFCAAGKISDMKI